MLLLRSDPGCSSRSDPPCDYVSDVELVLAQCNRRLRTAVARAHDQNVISYQ